MRYQYYPFLACVLVLASCVQLGGMTAQAPRTTSMTPGPGSASSGNWIDKLTEYVLMQKAISKGGDYQVYIADLRTAKDAREKGDWVGQHQALNRFIDKLDSRTGGISAESAQAIREYTFLVEPPGLHDLARDRKIHPEVMKWAERRARAREEAEKSF